MPEYATDPETGKTYDVSNPRNPIEVRGTIESQGRDLIPVHDTKQVVTERIRSGVENVRGTVSSFVESRFPEIGLVRTISGLLEQPAGWFGRHIVQPNVRKLTDALGLATVPAQAALNVVGTRAHEAITGEKATLSDYLTALTSVTAPPDIRIRGSQFLAELSKQLPSEIQDLGGSFASTAVDLASVAGPTVGTVKSAIAAAPYISGFVQKAFPYVAPLITAGAGGYVGSAGARRAAYEGAEEGSRINNPTPSPETALSPSPTPSPQPSLLPQPVDLTGITTAISEQGKQISALLHALQVASAGTQVIRNVVQTMSSGSGREMYGGGSSRPVTAKGAVRRKKKKKRKGQADGNSASGAFPLQRDVLERRYG